MKTEAKPCESCSGSGMTYRVVCDNCQIVIEGVSAKIASGTGTPPLDACSIVCMQALTKAMGLPYDPPSE